MRHSVFTTLATLVMVSCAGSPDDRVLRETSFHDFSDVPTGGWRGAAGQERYQDAANLIERYLEIEQGTLDGWQISVLQFHRAQMLACSGRTDAALAILPAGRITPQPADLPIDWNAMVEAVEAFLRDDRPALLEARRLIDAGGDAKTDRIEKAMVASLVREFGRSYRRAYEAGIDAAAREDS